MRRLPGALLLILLVSAAAPAQDSMPVPWANKFFILKDPPAVIVHDFGTVAQGTLLTQRFPITNIYAVPIQISSPRVSCGCVSGMVSKQVLQPRETGYLDLQMDGRKFSGHKAVTVWVDFGPQYRSTAVLQVRAHSRGDIVLNPGRIDFGVVAQGRKASQSVELQYLGGMANWQVAALSPESGPVEVSVQQAGRQRGRTVYTVTASLKPDAPAGALQHQIQLQTNDPTNPVVSVSVSGSIQAPFSVVPSNSVRFDKVKVGESTATNIIVQGTKPFTIQKVDGEGDGVTVEAFRVANRVQPVKIKFHPTQAGELHRELKLLTDSGNVLTVRVDGTAVTQ